MKKRSIKDPKEIKKILLLAGSKLGSSAPPPPLYDLRLYFDNDDSKRRQIGPFYGEDSAKAAVDCLESGQSNNWGGAHKIHVFCNSRLIGEYSLRKGFFSLDELIIHVSKIIDP